MTWLLIVLALWMPPQPDPQHLHIPGCPRHSTALRCRVMHPMVQTRRI